MNKKKKFLSNTYGSCPSFLATQEAEIRRNEVQSEPMQIVPETLSRTQISNMQKGW
jgi:hypothetical protein